MSEQAKEIRELVLTGDPAAVTRSALDRVRAALAESGWRVLVVPDATRLLVGGGVAELASRSDPHGRECPGVDHALLGVQLSLREHYRRIGDSIPDRRVVIVHDRAALDNAARLSAEEFADTAAAYGHHRQSLLALYDAVLHLRSPEDRDPPADRDAVFEDRALEAWIDHPHLLVVDAAPTLAETLERYAAAAAGIVGVPDEVEDERTFLLSGPVDLTHPSLARARTVEITQIYLEDDGDGSERRLRRRTVDGVSTWWLGVKRPVPGGGAERRFEHETVVNEHDVALVGRPKAGTRPVTKTRYVFAHGGQKYELDHLHSPVSDVWLLDVELPTVGTRVTVPPFLGPYLEVTDDPAWRSAALATRAS